MSHHNASNNLYLFKWCAKDDLKKIVKWLYPEGEYPFLPRKRVYVEDILKLTDLRKCKVPRKSRECTI